MLWEGYQQTKIVQASNQAQRAMSKAERYADDIADMKHNIERLSLACQAMWELLRDRSNVTEQDLETKILEIDARDGQVDGKMATQILTCPACGNATNSKRDSCVICGTRFSRQHKFEA